MSGRKMGFTGFFGEVGEGGWEGRGCPACEEGTLS